MVSPEAMPAPEGRIIGRYALYGEIAAGGMATVHFGRLVGPVGFSRTVAIKRLHPQFAKDPEFVSMFLDEARLAARIQHPNVVSTLDVVALEGEVFLVMDYVQGESLSKLVRATRRQGELVPARIASSIMAAALHGLHAAHEAKSERGEPLNIVHRDVSPQNVLVGVDGVARVLDFGVAKAAMRAQTTRDGQMKGKLSYMAPEQLRAKGVDRRTDIFAAGVVLWEALTGRRLFDGDDTGEILTKVLQAEIPPPGQVVPSIPPALDGIVLKALERDPAGRFATAREFAIALEHAGAVALNREVGEWVEEIGGDALARRAERVAEIESVSTVGAPFGAQAQELAAHRRSLAEMDAELPPGGSNPSAVSGVAPAGLVQARQSAPSWSGQIPAPGGEGTSPSQVSSLSVASAPHARPRRRQGLYAALLGVAAALGIAIVVVVVALVRRSVAAPSPASAAAQAPKASAPQVSLKPLDSAASEPVAAASEIAPAPSASAPAVESARPSASAPAVEQTARPVVHNPVPHHVYHHAAAKPKPAAKPNCNPPYTVDGSGIRHPKPECM